MNGWAMCTAGLKGCNKIGSMTCDIGRALVEIFLLQIVYQPVVEGMRSFGCAREFGKLVTGQGTPALVIERVWRGQLTSSRLWIGRPGSPARNVHFETP